MRVLFPTYGGGHVKAIIPIAKKLIDKGFDVVILSLSNSNIDLDASELAYSRVEEFINIYNAENIGRIIEVGKKFAAEHFSSPDFNTICYYGINLLEMFNSFGEEETRLRFEKLGRGCFLPLEFARSLLVELSIDKVFVTCGQRTELAFALEANKLNLPVFRLVDIVGKPIKIPYDATICVVNEIAKERIKIANPQLEFIHVTGNPNFAYNVRDNFKLSNIDESKKIISLFTQPNILTINSVLRDFFRLAKKLPNTQFYIKCHPSEESNYYKSKIPKVLDNLKVFEEGSSQELVSFSDAVFTFFSSVGMEAIIANKKLFILNYNSIKYPVDYVELNCATKVMDFVSLENAVGAVNRHDSVKTKSYEMMKQPLNSTDLIIRIIEDV
ncbi:hypothetical protein [Pseudoalteromonas maricaloris]|uniref:UDP-N-acetylglucosamine 2-epimerase domain-containing protein n=1 Tax=Pseudoalteromonas maricaloris TaxID=184924 RepID=A0A8I2H4K1_9GAMM|nr:hypothetical protein [Pseudoalteromonas maricaloris]NLR23398.1 hypothetical protein [Pseudoalteromonas maricaloris]WOX29222.1 hypothetical protein R5H13_02820 [Pseudoalteromonas maricaloris]